MSHDRGTLLDKAKICQCIERWNDMAQLMKTLATSVTELNAEERNLLSLACKTVIGAKRSSWRVISNIELQMLTPQNPRTKLLCKEYRTKIEKEISVFCSDLLKIVDKLLNSTEEKESKIFYLKMRADYYRYLAEFNKYHKNEDTYVLAKSAYEEALEIAKENVSPAHPIRLGLILNYSVFCQEILQLQGVAIDMARDAQKLAEGDLEHIKEESRNDSALIMELLDDNVALWTADSDDEIPRRKSVR